MGNINNINIEFREDEYQDIVHVMDSYTQRLRSLYVAKEKLRRDKIIWLASLIIILFLSVFSVYELSKLNSLPVRELLTGVLIATSVLFAIPTFIYLHQSSRTSLYDTVNDTREIVYTRKQLVKFMKYVSQVLDHNTFSPPKKFLMDVKLSEAEEVIFLTEKFFKKHSNDPSQLKNFQAKNEQVQTPTTISVEQLQAIIHQVQKEVEFEQLQAIVHQLQKEVDFLKNKQQNNLETECNYESNIADKPTPENPKS